MSSSMRNFLLQILAGLLGIYLSAEFIPNFEFHGPIKNLLLIGLILGFINYFIKPIVKFILFPLRILTFGLIGLVINIGIVSLITNYLFPDNFVINGFLPLLFTTLIISFLSTLFYASTKSFKD